MVGSKLTNARSTALGILMGLAVLCIPTEAGAWCIYNWTDETVTVNIPDYNWERTASPVDPGDEGKCCNWKDCAKADKASELVDVWITADEFLCIVEMRVDSYTLIQKEDRSDMGVPRQNIYCQSYDDFNPDELRMTSPYGPNKSSRDVRFLATADCQYWHNNETYEAIADGVMGHLKDQVLGTGEIRGLVIAGDLTQSSRRDEHSDYLDSIGGFSRFVHDGLGNHDQEYPGDSDQEAACFFGLNSCKDPDRIIDDIVDRKRSINLADKPSSGSPHYSWDWHDVHFVQINSLPANSAPPDYPHVKPFNALDWLEDDLATHVGDSGRPVVMVHHFGFDSFSTNTKVTDACGTAWAASGETWWTQDMRDDYWEVLAPYTVAAIITGHTHLDAGDCPRIDWSRPSGSTTGPDFIPTFVAGAARGKSESGSGTYLDITIDGDVLTVKQKDVDGNKKSEYSYDFSPPICEIDIPNPEDCTTRTLALDGSGSSDPAGGSLDYEWTTNCNNGSIDFPTSTAPDLVFSGTPNCSNDCHVILTVTNSLGLSTLCSEALDFQDRDQPSFDSRPAHKKVSCENADSNAETLTASDTCDSDVKVTASTTRLDGSCRDEYELTHSWDAKDDCGNIATHTQKVTVGDSIEPRIQGVRAQDRTAACHDVPDPEEPDFSDNCDPSVANGYSAVRTDGSCQDEYTLTRTWSAEDRCGNTNSVAYDLFVSDDAAPKLSGIPSDESASCDAVPELPTVTAEDNCDPSVSPDGSEVRTDGSCEDNYRLSRSWTVEDRCGNSRTRGYEVTVSDRDAPTFQGVPSDARATCEAVPDAPVVTSSDNCDPSVAPDYDQVRTDGSCEDQYTLTRTWSAEDRCGNEASSSYELDVFDRTDPTLIGVPQPVSVSCESVPAPAVVGSSDNCDPDARVDFDQVRQDGSCEDEYRLTRTWTATDRCSNDHSDSQLVDVFDRTQPVLLNLPPDIVVECDSVPQPANVQTTDNCDPATRLDYQQVRIDGDCDFNYVLKRTWTATDRCGNETSHTQTIRVQDTTPALVITDPENVACTWPPNHKYVDFPTVRGMVEVVDNCDPAPRVATVRCESSQCDNGDCPLNPGQRGDGNTVNDCVYDWGSDVLSTRSELGQPRKDGRSYKTWYTGIDTCGNQGPAAMGFEVSVPPRGGKAAEGCIAP